MPFPQRHTLASWLLPPKVQEILKRLMGECTKKNQIPSQQTTLNQLRFGTSRQPYLISMSRIRYGNSAAFSSEQHHFVRYFEEGRESLALFYCLHKPKTLREAMFLDQQASEPIRTGSGLVRREPWLHHDEFEIGAESASDSEFDGVQFWGPISEKRLAREIGRLDSLRESIGKNGFDWDRSDSPITGYLLIDDAGKTIEYVVVLCTGNHRLATLAFDGYSNVPFRFNSNYPREIRLSDVATWPGVISGDFSITTATQLFTCFFRDPNDILLDCW